MNEIERLLQKAGRAFEASEETLAGGHLDFAMSRACYGCFYIAQALLQSRGLDFSRHGQVIAELGRHFVKTGLLAPRFHTLLDHASSLRQSADYDPAAVIEAHEVVEVIRRGREFLAAASTFLETNPG